MAGYRFCRSDDIPLLVAAHNACWVPHFGADSAITVEDFKRGIRALGLWSSSCMVAFEGDEPIGVLIAAKRDGEANWVWRLAVKPGSERQGHGRHLVTSLADKAAILGPPRLLVEVPAAWTGVRAFFERSGFAVDATYCDFVRDTGSPAPATDDATANLLVPVTFDELRDDGAFDASAPRAWTRSAASLRARVGELAGLAIATDRVEAFVLFRDVQDTGEREIAALGVAAGDGDPRLLAFLVERIGAGVERLRFPRVGQDEIPGATLAALGFRRDGETIGYVARRG